MVDQSADRMAMAARLLGLGRNQGGPDLCNIRKTSEGDEAMNCLLTPRWQPATLFEHPPRSLIFCHICNRRRWAEYVEVQVYYDNINQRCKAGHGCRTLNANHKETHAL